VNSFSLVLRLLFSCLFLTIDASESEVQIDPEKRKIILELIEIEGQKELTREMLLEIMGSTSKNIPKTTRAEILAKINIDVLLEDLVSLYDKYLPMEELKEVIGAKRQGNEQKPSLYKRETDQINKLWEHKLTLKIQEKLWDKNIDFDIYDELEDFNPQDGQENQDGPSSVTKT
jgi:hypothetical protein